MNHGLCHCGCGEKPNPAPHNDATRGWVKGEPVRFVNGHQARKAGPRYEEQDRGYKTPCWVWLRQRSDTGYGLLELEGTTATAHRAFYEQGNGPIPEGLTLDHLCRVRECVNPDHLEAVPQAVNSQRGERAKITADDARAIRRSALSLTKLGAIYGIHPTQISRIKNRKAWSNV